MYSRQVDTDGPAGSRRMGWSTLPGHVRTAVEDALGAPVMQAVTQAGGFSPGVAARVLCANGSRAFVKAASPSPNPDTPELHRHEREVLEALPAGTPVPRLRYGYDDGEWVALVLHDIDGRQPVLPARRDDLDAVLAALGTLADHLSPAPAAVTVTLADVYGELLGGWRELAAAPPADLDPWVRRHLPRLVELEVPWQEATAGQALVHTDLRADNILVTGAGRAVVVDWAWACRGSPWVDLVVLFCSLDWPEFDEADRLLGGHPFGREVEQDRIDILIAAIAGMYTALCRRPPVPGLPTLRAWQREQARMSLRWLQHRVDWR